MRRAAFGLLVATTLGGCNQVFGLDETKPVPDAPDVIPPDAMWSSIQLGFLRLAFDPAAASIAAPAFTPFPDLMSVAVASFDGPLVTRAADAMGLVTIPLDITMAGPFRLVYQRTGDPVPHEYQNLVPNARVIEALFGPVTRPTVPANAGFLIKPLGAPTNHANNRVFTVGTWTEGKTILFPDPGNVRNFDYTYQAPNTVSMSGPLGLTAATDAGVLVDYNATVPPCEGATGSSRFPAGNAAAHTDAIGDAWNIDSVTRMAATNNNVALPAQIRPFFDETAPTHRENYGFVPSQMMPSFTRRPPGGLNPIAFLENPVMMVMRTCSAVDIGTAAHHPTLFKDKLTEAIYTETTVERSVGGILLTNGVGVLTLIPTPQTVISVATNVAFANGVVLKSAAATSDLFVADSNDQIPVAATTGSRTLSWTWAGNTGKADYWEVTLLEMTSPLPTKRKTYTTTNVTKTTTTTTTTVRIDAADLTPNKQYVFQISAFVGRPDAAAGDFSRVVGNQAISVIHTHTFIPAP